MTSETETAARLRAARSVLVGRTMRAFYVVVLVVALVGSSTAAQGWLLGDPEAGKSAPWWFLPLALVAVSVYELGAVAVSRFADQRRQLGERALVARASSAALAGGAIAAQALGHSNPGQAAFFAGVSATGYVAYLLESAANRRDALREDGKLADTPPAYGWFQWVRHFWITRRARALALARSEARLLDKALPPLGRVASLEAAADQVRAEKRLAAIEDALRARIAAGVDKTMAKIAVNTYDMARVAAGIAAAADYPALTRIITAELVPARLVKLDDQAAEDQAVAGAAAAITAHVAAKLATAPVPRPPLVPAGVRTLPIVPVAAPVPAPPAVETAPVPPAVETETVVETAPVPPARPRPATVPLTQLPPSLQTLINGRTPGSVPAPRPAETEPPAAETAPVSEPADTASDQGGTGETGAETAGTNGVDPLAGVEDKLLPYLRMVIAAHPGWPAAVKMPPKHPEALTVTKIHAACNITGKSLGCAIKGALVDLAEHPKTAEAALRSRGLADATRN